MTMFCSFCRAPKICSYATTATVFTYLVMDTMCRVRSKKTITRSSVDAAIARHARRRMQRLLPLTVNLHVLP